MAPASVRRALRTPALRDGNRDAVVVAHAWMGLSCVIASCYVGARLFISAETRGREEMNASSTSAKTLTRWVLVQMRYIDGSRRGERRRGRNNDVQATTVWGI